MTLTSLCTPVNKCKFTFLSFLGAQIFQRPENPWDLIEHKHFGEPPLLVVTSPHWKLWRWILLQTQGPL